MVKSAKPVHTLRQCLNVQCEVASSNRLHTLEYGKLPLQDSNDHNFKFPVELCTRLSGGSCMGSVVLCWSPLTSHVIGVYLSMVEVQDTSCHLVGSSCWGDV